MKMLTDTSFAELNAATTYILGEQFLPLSRASYSEAEVCKLNTRTISSTFYSL